MKYSIAFMILAINSQPVIGLAENNPWAQPIWKSPPLPENPAAAFDKHDPYALAIGAKIKTDCSIRYIWNRDGRLYCFNSLTSKAFFLDNPAGYIRRAKQFMQDESNPGGSNETQQ